MNHFATSVRIDEQIETTIAGLVPKMNSDMKDQPDLPFTKEELQHLFPKYDQPKPLDLMDCQQHFFKSIGLSKAYCHLYLSLYLELKRYSCFS